MDRPKVKAVDPHKLKLSELMEVEAKVGRRLSGELQAGDLGMDTMTGLLWIILRREDPSATFEQAADYDLDAIMDAFTDEDDQPPELPPGKADPTPATRNGGVISEGEPGAGLSKAMPSSNTSGV